eukprot:5177250-Prymnesium_polylepis.1
MKVNVMSDHVMRSSSLNLAVRTISTLSDDRLDGFNRFGSHVPGPGIGVGWQLSKYWNIC